MKTTIIALLLVLFGFAANSQPSPKFPKSTAEIKFDTEVYEFGIIPYGVPVNHVFKVTNTGKAPLLITNVSASCGCVTYEWTKEPILPNKTGFVKATYNAASDAPFSKTLTVTSNAGRSTVVLTIKGVVKAQEQPKNTF